MGHSIYFFGLFRASLKVKPHAFYLSFLLARRPPCLIPAYRQAGVPAQP